MTGESSVPPLFYLYGRADFIKFVPMNIDNILNARHSVRNFDSDRKISHETVVDVLSSVLLSPSWKNSQTPRYHVVESAEVFGHLLGALSPRNTENASRASVLVVSTFVKDVAGFNREGQPDNELGNGWGIYDAGLSNAIFLMKAAESGIDSLVMGIRDAERIREILQIPEQECILSVIALGYRVSDPVRPARKSLGEIVKFY